MTIGKLFYIGVLSLCLIASYSFGYNSGKEDVKCDDCNYWKTEVYDVVYIGSIYQKMYYSCVEGEPYPESDSSKRMIDELVTKYGLNEGVAKP